MDSRDWYWSAGAQTASTGLEVGFGFFSVGIAFVQVALGLEHALAHDPCAGGTVFDAGATPDTRIMVRGN